MLSNLNLKPTYNSEDDDIPTIFYTPALIESYIYKRASAYFSAKALSLYSTGLDKFEENGGKYFLIISREIEESDFNEIKIGIQLREEISKGLVEDLKEDLEYEDYVKLSNFAYLLAIGVIELRIAFIKDGIFHDKFGIFYDQSGNKLYFRGSNNETYAAIKKNYESFDITYNWGTSEFEESKIVANEQKFNEIWDNKAKNIVVLPVEEVVKNEILKFSKGRIIDSSCFVFENCFVLDLDQSGTFGARFLFANIVNFHLETFYVFSLKKYVQTYNIGNIQFNSDVSYIDMKKIIHMCEEHFLHENVKVLVTKKLRDYIDELDYKIKERKNVGISIRNKSEKIRVYFENYKKLIDSIFVRPLREQQMWDSFFMATMKRSSNFSVPGSGKTSSTLGVYAYYRNQGTIKRIVIVGPKSSFESWIREYKLCFGTNPLQVFNWHDIDESSSNKIMKLRFESANVEMFLFNYEMIPSIVEFANEIIDKNTMLVLDEVHKVKNPQGYFASNILKFAKNCEYIIALTGTPIPNSYTDIYNLLHLLYKNEYNYYFAFSQSFLVKPNSAARIDINNRLFPFYCRTTKAMLDVPKINDDITRSSKATDFENSLFEIVFEKYKRNVLALYIRLIQLDSDPRMISKELTHEEKLGFCEDDIDGEQVEKIENINLPDIPVDFETSKFIELIKLIENLVSDQKTVIIWCIFIHSIEKIKSTLSSLGISCKTIYGITPNEDRVRILEDFREKGFSVLITNPHTLAESVSLHQSCHDAVYFEYSFNLVHLLQSKDRIHRLGLPDNQYTQYYFLHNTYFYNQNEFSIGEKTHERLKLKENIMIEAIENNKLEDVFTTEDDLKAIFKNVIKI